MWINWADLCLCKHINYDKCDLFKVILISIAKHARNFRLKLPEYDYGLPRLLVCSRDDHRFKPFDMFTVIVKFL